MSWKCAVKAGTATAVAAVVIAVAGAATAAASGSRVTVRVEGSSRTLLGAGHATLRGGWFVKGGHGRGVCSGDSAQAALAQATHGHWAGTWYASYGEWEITRILGATPGGSSHWWELFVDNRPAQAGACQERLRPGDHVVFAAVAGNGEALLGLRAPGSVTRGHRFSVHVVSYDAHGRAHPLRGATVNLNGHRTTTGRDGVASLLANVAGVRQLRVSDRGHVRIERRVRVRA